MKEEKTSFWDQMSDARVIIFTCVYFGVLLSTAFLGYSLTKETVQTITKREMESPQLYNVRNFDVSMSTLSTKIGTAKVEMRLQVATKDVERLPKYMPRIMDKIQTSLLETNVEDLKRSANLKMFREDLLFQVNTVSGPVKVQDIYFKKFITN